jgi:hypothetical protein
MLKLCVCIFVVICALSTVAKTAQTDSTLKLSIELTSPISLHEPAVAKIGVFNAGDEAIDLDLGTNYKSGWQYWIGLIPDG